MYKGHLKWDCTSVDLLLGDRFSLSLFLTWINFMRGMQVENTFDSWQSQRGKVKSQEVNKRVQELLFWSKSPLRIRRICDGGCFLSIYSRPPPCNFFSFLLLPRHQSPATTNVTSNHLCQAAAGTRVPVTSGKTDFEKTMVLPLTVRCSLEITNVKACPPTEHKGRLTVHSTDVKAGIVYIHRIQNQLWRIAMGNLDYRWTKKCWNLDWFNLNQDQTLQDLFQCPKLLHLLEIFARESLVLCVY